MKNFGKKMEAILSQQRQMWKDDVIEFVKVEKEIETLAHSWTCRFKNLKLTDETIHFLKISKN